MISRTNLFRLSRHTRVDEAVLDELFALERSTLITTMLLETILLYILTPLIGNIMFAWYGLIMTLSLWRFYNAYDYHKHPERNSPLVWHEKFVVQVWLTALLFSLLALFAVPQLDAYYQLFTFIVLIGISSGAIKALSSDHRTAIGYLLIILLPLMIEMFLLMRKETYILGFLVAIYLFVQISILLRSYELSLAARKARLEADRVRRVLTEKQEIIHRFFEETDEALFLYDRKFRLIDCNHTFEKLFDVPAEVALEHTLDDFPDTQWVAMIQASLARGTEGYLTSYHTRDGRQLWLEARCLAMADDVGISVGGIGLIKDKTAEHATQQELAHLARHDPMTGLANRRGFQEYMDRLFADPLHATHYSLFFYMDVNKFKQINDQYGHERGDNVIVEVASRLKKLVPEQANLTRLGGDEFCMVLPHVGREKDELLPLVQEWTEKIHRCFEEPLRIGTQTFTLRSSIGAVFVEPKERNTDKVVAQADIAMLKAKRNGSGSAVLYTPDLEAGECQAYEIHHMLGEAIRQEQLEIFYQPIARSGSREVVAVEALVRWRHPDKGLLSPEEFLPVTVRSGQITQVDTWMLRGVMMQIARWKEEGIFTLDYVSINIDVQSFIAENFIDDLLREMAQRRVAGNEIRLELAESALAENLDRIQSTIEELDHHGVMCVVDDFGTGCLSLFELRNLPLGAIKVDRIFLQNKTGKMESFFLLKAIIELVEKFHHPIIVKGIETEAQRTMIASIDPSIRYQGSLLAEPLAVRSFEDRFLPAEPSASGEMQER